MGSNYSEFKYDAAVPCNAESGRLLADFIVRLIQSIEEIECICDLGCGNGYLAGRLGSLGYSVTGIDASESGIEIAGREYAGKNMEFMRSEIGKEIVSSVGAGRFDLVVSIDVIEHLYRPADLLETAYGLLRPGGYLLLSTPYHGYLKNLALSLFNKWDDHHTTAWDGGHIKFFSMRTLRCLVSSSGFEDLRFHFHGRARWLWKSMVCIARKPSHA